MSLSIIDSIKYGLNWLESKQNKDGSWGTPSGNPPYPYDGVTGLVLFKFVTYALENGYSPFDEGYIYKKIVESGFDYIFSKALFDSTGIFFADYQFVESYSTGIVLSAICATSQPNKVINSTNNAVNGKTFKEVAQSMVNYLTSSQLADGGWGYYKGDLVSDNSNTGYVMLGLESSISQQYGFECNIDSNLKSKIGNWVNNIQYTDGGSCYQNYGQPIIVPIVATIPCSCTNGRTNSLRTGNLIAEMYFYGESLESCRLKKAITYIADNWNVMNLLGWQQWSPNNPGNANYQATFTIMKGLSLYGIKIIEDSNGQSIDWFNSMSTVILNEQVFPNPNPNNYGYWNFSYEDNFSKDPILSTVWALLTLEKIIPKSNLSLIKSADKFCAVVGDIVKYTITAKNTGEISLNNAPLTDVYVYDILPPELEFKKGSIAIDDVKYPDESIIAGIDLGTINLGESKTITFDVEVMSNVNDLIENTSQGMFKYMINSAASRGGRSISNPFKLKVGKASMDIIKTSNKSSAAVGDYITYTVQLINTGTLDAMNVIFRDDLPSIVEFLKGSFKLNTKVINLTQDILRSGINIGNIYKGETAIIEYTAKVIGSNCSLKVTNSASVEFKYMCEYNSGESYVNNCGCDSEISVSNSVGIYKSKPSNTSISDTVLSLQNFKQIILEKYLNIPIQKPDLEVVNNITGSVSIIKYNVIETPKSTSSEGQKLSEYKLIVHGFLKVIVEYTALDLVQSVHVAHFNVPFSTFIILGDNYTVGSKFDISGTVEGIDYTVHDNRNLFFNSTILMSTKLLSC